MKTGVAPNGVRASGLSRAAAWAPLAALWLLVGALLLPTVAAGDFWWTDEARHAMGGVFVADAVRDWPVADPMGYALRYFAQYPALALNWYLPGFYAVEAVAFSIFGASQPVARALVFLFCIVGVSVWYAWLRRGWGTAAAFLAVAAWVTPPVWNLWARSVMLEAPVVTMLVVSVWAFDRYLAAPSHARSVAVGLSLAGALLIKHTAAFMLPALLLYAIATPARHALWRREAIPGVIIVAAALLIDTVHALKFGSQALSSIFSEIPPESGAVTRWSIERWTLFPKTLWATWGPFMTLLSLAGALLPSRGRERQLPMVYAWVLCWYVAVTLVLGGPNAARYTMYVFPALGLLAARPVFWLRDRTSVMAAAVVVVALGVGSNLWRTVNAPVPQVDGYRAVAAFVHATGTRAPILYAGKHDGNFIFDLRGLDPGREHVVLRADKLLLSLAVHKYYGMQSHVRSDEDVKAMIARYGVQYIVLESPDILKLKEFEMLRRVLNDARAFEQVAVLPVSASGGADGPSRVEVYRFRDFKPGAGEEIVIPLPHMGREIRFKPG